MERTTNKVEVLLPDGVVEALGVAPGVHGLARGMLAQDDRGGICGKHAHEQKHDDRKSDEDGNRL